MLVHGSLHSPREFCPFWARALCALAVPPRTMIHTTATTTTTYHEVGPLAGPQPVLNSQVAHDPLHPRSRHRAHLPCGGVSCQTCPPSWTCPSTATITLPSLIPLSTLPSLESQCTASEKSPLAARLPTNTRSPTSAVVARYASYACPAAGCPARSAPLPGQYCSSSLARSTHPLVPLPHHQHHHHSSPPVTQHPLRLALASANSLCSPPHQHMVSYV